jgi:hypothetical protein
MIEHPKLGSVLEHSVALAARQHTGAIIKGEHGKRSGRNDAHQGKHEAALHVPIGDDHGRDRWSIWLIQRQHLGCPGTPLLNISQSLRLEV